MPDYEQYLWKRVKIVDDNKKAFIGKIIDYFYKDDFDDLRTDAFLLEDTSGNLFQLQLDEIVSIEETQ